MKDQRKTEIKVGSTVILGLVIFLWILGWAKNFSFRDTDRLIRIKFNTVSGLEVGDYVTVNGVRKGIVEDFNIENNGVIVKLSIDFDVVLKEDAVFAVTMLDLMGGKKIDIKPGNAAEELKYSELQQGVFYADIPAVMTMIGNAQEDLFKALTEVNTTLTSINSFITDQKFEEEFQTTLTNMSEISSKLNSMIDENRKGLNELLENSLSLSGDIREIVSENRQSIESSIRSLEKILAQTDSLTYGLNIITGETRNRQNNLGKLLYDEKLMEDLTETLSKTRELILILTEQLQNEGIKVDADVDLF